MLKTLIRAVLAGISISLGGTVYLMMSQEPVAAAALFTVGLFCVCVFGFDLFTGKVCYAPERDRTYALALPVIWLGNLAGAVCMGLLVRLTRFGPALAEKAADICANKLGQSALSAVVLAFLCNMLIYIAVEGYRTIPHEAGKYLALFFGVMVFILCGFEHCVANIFYFTAGGAWSLHAVLWLLLMTLGNALGGVFLPLLRRFCRPSGSNAGNS